MSNANSSQETISVIIPHPKHVSAQNANTIHPGVLVDQIDSFPTQVLQNDLFKKHY